MFTHPLKTSGNYFFDVFRGYRNVLLGKNGLNQMYQVNTCLKLTCSKLITKSMYLLEVVVLNMLKYLRQENKYRTYQ